MKKINIIIPIFNEEESIAELVQKIKETSLKIKEEIVITMVDDGSSDKSWEIIQNINDSVLSFRKIKFSRNFGHQPAIFCGLEHFQEDAAIIIDADFQDNPDYIPQLIDKWKEENDIVLAKRISRNESFVRRVLINTYFKIQNRFTEVKIPKNVGHFSLLDKKIVDNLIKFPENKKFLLGLRSYVGFNVAYVEVVKDPRKYGDPKMSFAQLIKLSSEGLIGFSNTPLNLIGILGFIVSISSIIFALYTFIQNQFFGNKLLNWDFGLTSIYFLSGIQLLSISVLGQYISKIFDESKNRPFYIIDKSL